MSAVVLELSTSEFIIRLVEALVWPLAFVLALLLLVAPQGRQFTAQIMQRLRRVSAFGVDVELTAEAATRNKADLETTFATYRQAIVREFDRQGAVLHIPELRRHVVEEVVRSHLAAGNGVHPAFRCTIHVRDILINETMYQLLDYYPAATSRRTAGRTFSMRFGIVGEAWRTGESQSHTIESTRSDYPVKHWGMLPEEAAAYGHGSLSFAAVVLQHAHATVGVFYLDSRTANAFQDDIRDAVAASATDCGLTSALADLESSMRQRGPAISVFDA